MSSSGISAATHLLAFLSLLGPAAGKLRSQQDSELKASQPALQSPFERTFPAVPMTVLAGDLAQPGSIEVGGRIPNYVESDRWGELGEPISVMQQPLPPAESLKRAVIPKGFRVELFASEPELQGKPICIAWDERGRLWVGETIDYPNELNDTGKGRDRIRICEDTDGDGRADKFVVFADNLSIPTSIAFARSGVIVQNGNETVFLKDTNGDDVADERSTWITGWNMSDTHGGVSNFQYGLDNWIWAMQGYNASSPEALGKPQQPFRMGFFRMRPDGSQVEFLRSTNNNTWGLGISEEGLIFGSTANGNPSVFLPIPNRYYERVRGWTPSLTLSSIADSNRFLPVTDRVRQVDHFGGYTAAAGHALYTARQYPEVYWNRVAYVCEPTGHLVGSFVLSQAESGFKATNPFNLFASIDEWSAPIMAEVGPDGNVWVVDWYNYIVQHNPTPKGFQTGKGNAYESDLRDKKHARIFRVVYDAALPITSPDLRTSTPKELVATLRHSVMITRKHAQRLLVERGRADVAPDLMDLIRDHSVDSIGMNPAAIHALWTLHGLGLIENRHPEVLSAVFNALEHPSPGVRRNAVQVLPHTKDSVRKLLDAGLLKDSDPNVRLASILAVADLPTLPEVSDVLVEALSEPAHQNDRWILDAITSAAASSGSNFLVAVSRLPDCPDAAGQVCRVVAEHYARGDAFESIPEVINALRSGSTTAIRSTVQGLAAGWQDEVLLELGSDLEADLEALVERVPAADRPVVVRLAQRWGSERFSQYSVRLTQELLDTVLSEEASDESRMSAAKHAVEFQPESQAVTDGLLGAISPKISPELAQGILDALESARSDSLPASLIGILAQMPPATKNAIIRLLLKREAYSLALLDAIENRQLSLNDLALDQRQALSRHQSRQVRSKLKVVLESNGALPNQDRFRVLEELNHTAHRQGDSARGKVIFQQHCSKCHLHEGVGTSVGPDLTGMSVHPKEEMLIHIIDPNRSVESNFRAYSVLTVDGVVLTGMLAAESKSSIELFDTEGKRQVILREHIEHLSGSTQSIMPEGFEKTLTSTDFTDLLEYLSVRGTYVPLDLSKVATVASDRGMFLELDGPERIHFDNWSSRAFQGIPFQLIPPREGRVFNAIVLHSPLGSVSRQLPTSVSLVCSSPVRAIHILGGVAGWAYPLGTLEEVVMVVRLTYADGQIEDHELLNGVHIADYIRRIDVPQSQIAFSPGGKQVRYLSIEPKRSESLSTIELVKGDGDYAPLVLAVTVEPLPEQRR